MSQRNLQHLFQPRSIALVGGSRRPGSVGAVVAENLMTGGFDGPIMPVHPEARAIHGTLAYPSVDDLPLTPDLAVIATPPDTIPGIVARLGERGTRAAVVISAGFGELGEAGKKRETALLEAARPHLLRICGPNCIGIAVPGRGVNASFVHTPPLKGDLALVSQSGAVLAAALDWATARGIGFSHLVSLGDMADVDFGDMLDYLLGDPSTRAILLYVEAVTHARKFMSAARAAARVKPVIVLKAGRSAIAAKAAASHTGALAGEDAVADAAFRRAGMLRVDSLNALFEAVETLGKGFNPKGDRLAVLTNGGGVGVIATDALIAAGGRLAELSEETRERLDSVLPPTWSRGNPVDIIGDADGERYGRALEILLEDRGVDATLVMNCPTAVADSLEAAEAIITKLEARRRPVLANWLGEGAAAEARRRFARARIPSYATPSDAVEAFMQLVAYRRNQEELMQLPAARLDEPEYDLERARSIIDAALAEGRAWLGEFEAKALLAAYAIPTVRTEAVASAEEAAAAAEAIGGPVALKIQSRDITHKSDVGGVRLGLEGGDEVRLAAEHMAAHVRKLAPEARIEGFTVQEMAAKSDGVELLLGANDDPVFGPVLAFGAGGTAVEVLQDTALNLVPITPELARATMARTRVSRLLEGHRGRPPADQDAVAQALVRLGQIMVDLDHVAEIDINPLLADAQGILALDARVRLAEPRVKGEDRLAIHPYARELETEVALRDGTPVPVRPIRPDDAAALQAMIEKSDLEDLRLRFFTALRRLPPQMAARLTQIDYDREIAFVALGAEEAIIGVARLAADPDLTRAEFGILVRSDMKGRGLGYRLMQALIGYARSRGIGVIQGEVLLENRAMLQMCEEFGFRSRTRPEDRIVEVVLDVAEAPPSA